MKKNTIIDNTIHLFALAQDPGNVAGCFEQGTLNMYATVPDPDLNMPTIIRMNPV